MRCSLSSATEGRSDPIPSADPSLAPPQRCVVVVSSSDPRTKGKRSSGVDELVVRLGPEDVAGLNTLISEGGSGSNAEAMALQLFREGLATRLQVANERDPEVGVGDAAPDTLEAEGTEPKSGVAGLMANDRTRRSTLVAIALGV